MLILQPQAQPREPKVNLASDMNKLDNGLRVRWLQFPGWGQECRAGLGLSWDPQGSGIRVIGWMGAVSHWVLGGGFL